MAADFYASLPVIERFRARRRAGRLSARARRLARRFRRRQGLDGGGRGRALQGGQHDRRRRGGGGVERAPAQGRFRSCSAATARASPSRPTTRRRPRPRCGRWRPSRARNSSFDLRIAMAEVADIRAGGRDVRRRALRPLGPLRLCDVRRRRPELARRGRPRPAASRWQPAPAGARPDLSDLSCRWGVSPARHGLILSLIVAPRGDDPRFAPFLAELVRRGAGDRGRRAGRSRSRSLIAGPAGRRSVAGIGGVSRRRRVRRGASRPRRRPALRASPILFKTFDLKVGDFDMKRIQARPRRQRRFPQIRRRPADDARLHARLRRQDRGPARRRADFVEWGALRQEGAQITCYSPLVGGRGHCISSTAPAAATRWRPRR